MELAALQNLSPTLVEKQLRLHTHSILNGSQIFNSKDCILTITAFDIETGKKLELFLTELPDEIRQGIHNYTTRLCAEKLLLETALDKG